MKPTHNVYAILCGMCITATIMAVDELLIFPTGGRSSDQQEADKYACYSWVKKKPALTPWHHRRRPQHPPKPTQKKAVQVGGLLRGAAVGGIVSGSDGTNKGAGAGAALGTARRNDQKRSVAKSQQDWEKEQVAIYTGNRNQYNRAYGAGLEGKNYTVR